LYKHFRQISMTGIRQICYGEKDPVEPADEPPGWLAGQRINQTGGAAMRQFSVKTQARSQMIDITAQSGRSTGKAGSKAASALSLSPHDGRRTINENADPTCPGTSWHNSTRRSPARGLPAQRGQLGGPHQGITFRSFGNGARGGGSLVLGPGSRSSSANSTDQDQAVCVKIKPDEGCRPQATGNKQQQSTVKE